MLPFGGIGQDACAAMMKNNGGGGRMAQLRNFSFRGTPKSRAMPHRPAVRRLPSARLLLGWLHSSRKEAARQDVNRRIVPVVLDAVFQEVQFAPNGRITC